MGESGMTKFVINTVEVVKRVYLADAYTEEEALKKQKEQALNNGAEKVVELGELLYSIETINEYEYNKEWKPLDPDIGPDQLKDGLPHQRELFELEPVKDYYDQ